MRSRRSTHRDGGVIAFCLRNLAGFTGFERSDNCAIVGGVDEVFHRVALKSRQESFGLRGLLFAGAHGDDVAVFDRSFRSGVLGSKRSGRIDVGADSVIAVDNGHVDVGQHARKACRLGLDDFDVVRVLRDIVFGGVQADAVGKLDDALVLQQKQSASLVGGVGGNGDLLRGAAAAAHQGNGKTAGRNGASAYGRNFFEFHS